MTITFTMHYNTIRPHSAGFFALFPEVKSKWMHRRGCEFKAWGVLSFSFSGARRAAMPRKADKKYLRALSILKAGYNRKTRKCCPQAWHAALKSVEAEERERLAPLYQSAGTATTAEKVVRCIVENAKFYLELEIPSFRYYADNWRARKSPFSFAWFSCVKEHLLSPYSTVRRMASLRRAHSLRRTISRSRTNTAHRASSFTAAPSHDDSGGDGGGSDDGDGQSGDDHHHVTFAVGLSACGLFVLDSAKQDKFIHGSGVGLAACCGVVNGRFFVPFRGVEVSA